MKKIFSLLMLTLMLLSIMPVVSYGSYDDTKDHWAEGSIDKWTEYGVATPRSDGEFAPNELMTRGEAAVLFCNLLGLNKTADLSKYKDIDVNSKYADAISKCVAAGIFVGRGDGKMDSEDSITREEFMCVFSRVISLESNKSADDSKKAMTSLGFKDANKVSGWAAGCVDLMIELGFVDGVGDNTIAPKAGINRASVIALLDKSISTYIAPDTEVTTVEAKPKGITLIASEHVESVTGDAEIVLVAAGAEYYDEKTGEITHNEVTVESVKMPTARIQGENITVVLSGATTTKDAGITKTGEKSEYVIKSTASVDNVSISSKDGKVTVEGTVGTVTVGNKASNVEINTSTTGKVTTVENNGQNTQVTGNGTVNKVETSENIKVETNNTAVENTNEDKQIIVSDKNGSGSLLEKNTGDDTNTNTDTVVNRGSSGGGSGSSGGSTGDSHTHTFESSWSTNTNQHWHESTCEHEVVDSLASHTWIYATSTDTNYHVKTCSVCEYGYMEEHIWQKATGTGLVCSLCGKTQEGAFVTTNTELAEAIKLASQSDGEYVIQLDEGDFSGYYEIMQYPEWDWQTNTNSNLWNYRNNLTPANVKRTRIVIKGAPNGKSYFSGRFLIVGTGNSGDGYPIEDPSNVYTVFDGIYFKDTVNYDISVTRYTSGKFPIIAAAASMNVEVKNCSFVNTGRIYSGLDGSGGGHTFNFSIHNCTFDNCACVLQGYMHGNLVTVDTVTATNLTSGFMNIQGSDHSIDPQNINVSNCSIEIIHELTKTDTYLFRVKESGTINIQDSVFTNSNGYIVDNQLSNGTNSNLATFNFTNCTLNGTGNSFYHKNSTPQCLKVNTDNCTGIDQFPTPD